MTSRRRMPRLGAVVLAGAGATVLVAACADSENDVRDTPDSAVSVPGIDGDVASADAGTDASDGETSAPVDCTQTAFCPFAAPIPPLVTLNSIWGKSATDIWAVGTRGTILHGDGTTFRVMPSGTEEIFFSVWGSAHDDVWITSGRVPRHSRTLDDGGIAWDVTVGINWNEWDQNNGRIWTIWGTSADDVWMAGLPTTRFGDPGCFWTKMPVFGGDIAWQRALAHDRLGLEIQPGIRALWGMGPDHIWGVGQRGSAYLYKGSSEGLPGIWTQATTQTGHDLTAVWGTNYNDVWAVGQAGTILHYTADATQSFQFVPSPTTENLGAIWGSNASDIWAAGDHGVTLHYDGTSWTVVDVGLRSDPLPNLHGLWGSGPDDVWIVGDDVMLHRTKDSRRQP